jgi:uncharacterized glyoxalase superfamily protein PhnB
MTTAIALQAKNMVPSVTANDLTKSLRFYTEGLGFEITDRYEIEGRLQGAMLKAGEAVLGISQDDFKKGKDRVKGLGMSLYIETDQDIVALAEKVKAAGITLTSGPEPLPWGPMGFTVTDPDGFKTTISNTM